MFAVCCADWLVLVMPGCGCCCCCPNIKTSWLVAGMVTWDAECTVAVAVV